MLGELPEERGGVLELRGEPDERGARGGVRQARALRRLGLHILLVRLLLVVVIPVRDAVRAVARLAVRYHRRGGRRGIARRVVRRRVHALPVPVRLLVAIQSIRVPRAAVHGGVRRTRREPVEVLLGRIGRLLGLDCGRPAAVCALQMLAVVVSIAADLLVLEAPGRARVPLLVRVAVAEVGLRPFRMGLACRDRRSLSICVMEVDTHRHASRRARGKGGGTSSDRVEMEDEPRSSRTRLSSSAIRFRRRVFSSMFGSSLGWEMSIHGSRGARAHRARRDVPQGGVVHLVYTEASLRGGERKVKDT